MLRRLRRVTFTAAAIASLVVGVACLGLWGRARFESDHWEWRSSRLRGRSYDSRAWAVRSATDGLHFVATSSHQSVDNNYGLVLEDETAGPHWLLVHDGWRWDVEVPGPFWSLYFSPSSVGPSIAQDYLPATLQVRGFHLARFERPRAEVGIKPGTAWTVGVPTWFPAVVLALPPIAWEVGYRRWLRRQRGARRASARPAGTTCGAHRGGAPSVGRNGLTLPPGRSAHSIRRPC